MSLNSLRDGFNRVKKKYDEFNQQHNLFPSSQSYQQPSQHQQYFPPQGGYNPYYQQQQYQPPSQYDHQPQPTYQQQNYVTPPPPPEWNRPPPAVPQHSRPSQQPVHHIYWQAKFDPSIPVSQEWEQQLGNCDGWGNEELEHYTANAENAFFTSDNKLVLRAIANNSCPTHEGRYTSARLVSRRTLSRARGVVTAILQSPCATGIWPAFWLLPREPSKWPEDGEIDIAETWNADHINRSCLHWGTYTPQDAEKHRVLETRIDGMGRRAVRYDFAWDQESERLMWYIDGQPVMKATAPHGARQLHDWCVILNVAMGGTVCAGQAPKDGAYDFIVHSVFMSEELEAGGWSRFHHDWQYCSEGKSM